MTHRLAMEASDIFTAVVSVAGMMPEEIWINRNESNDVGIFQITGEKDDVVPKNSDGSAKYSKAPAIEDVMDYWVKSNGLEEAESSEIGKGSIFMKYAKEGKDRQVWNLFIKDGRHSWPDEKITGIDINALILEFMEQ
jgi:poly(3-hydroxybutyrate) depolymerase